jgi:hypothetical protein
MVKLFVATPMYGGQCHGGYTDSVIKLAVECHKRAIEFHFFSVFNQSHIDTARNVCVDEFLRSGFTHLLFIDSDIQFQVPQALDLLSADRDIVCGFYPKKRIDWKRIVEAVKLGYGDKDPELLEQFVGDMVFTPALKPESSVPRSIYDLTELHEGGTGFMLIKRRVFDHIAAVHPELRYTDDKQNQLILFFDAQLTDEPYRRHLTEDYSFCALARAAGFTIWLAPWIKLVHHGYYRWVGNIEALAKVAMKEAA